jgi:YHS domain-containing protein
MNRLFAAGLIGLALAAPAVRADDDAKEALQELNAFIGGWKGTGGPMGSAKIDNWNEKLDWGWRFKGEPALSLEIKNGKFFTKGLLRYDVDKKKYLLTLTDKEGKDQVFVGGLKKGYLTMESVDAKTGDTHQLMLNTAAEGLRFNYTYAKKSKGSTVFNKVYQVQAGKEGESLAGGPKEKECVVTGGKGTIEVSYQGKTYYVCCSGCRDAFKENPAKIIKEAEERKKKGN